LNLSGTVSHQIILIYPGTSRNAFESSFPTHYIYEKIQDTLSNHKLEVVARLYEMYARVPNAKNNAGYMLEDAVSDVFFRGGEWSLVSMTKSNRTGHWKGAKGPTSPVYLHLGYMGRHIAINTSLSCNCVPLRKCTSGKATYTVPTGFGSGYYYPSSRSQEMFDAFIYESASKAATVFQVTTSSTHSVKEGIKWLQGWGVKEFRYIAVYLMTPQLISHLLINGTHPQSHRFLKNTFSP